MPKGTTKAKLVKELPVVLKDGGIVSVCVCRCDGITNKITFHHRVSWSNKVVINGRKIIPIEFLCVSALPAGGKVLRE